MEDIIRIIAQPLGDFLYEVFHITVIAQPDFVAAVTVAIPFFLFGGFLILAAYHYDYV